MSKKTGGNSAKIGRHSRNPSSKLQAARSARNKAAAVKRAGKAAGHICPRHPTIPDRGRAPIPMGNSGRIGFPHYEATIMGVVVEVSPSIGPCDVALRQSMVSREKALWLVTEGTRRRVEAEAEAARFAERLTDLPRVATVPGAGSAEGQAGGARA